MSGINQKEYLKKYLGIGKGSGEKKKKKKVKKLGSGLKIVDDDVDIRLNEEIKVDLAADNDEAPQIVSVIDDRPPSLRIDEETHSKLWKPIGVPDEAEHVEESLRFKGNIKLSRLGSKQALLKNILPSRRSKAQVNSDCDNSPPRKKHTGLPVANKEDHSPPRKRRKSKDISPQRRTRTDRDSSLPRRSKTETKRDASPPRRGKGADGDFSPSRSIKIEISEDDSPPRKRNVAAVDSSPPRMIKRERSEDISPPRRKDAGPDSSPPRTSKRSKSEDKSPPRRRRDRSTGPKRSRWGNAVETTEKMDKTLDGKVAGLQNAAALAKETEELKKREDELFKKLGSEISGANAMTIVRKKNKEVDLEEEERKRKAEEENKEKYNRWGRGLKQVDDVNERMKNDLYEMSKPLARYADDEDLEKHLKDQEREGDPMLAYIRQKKRKKAVDQGVPDIQQYQGDAPPNRFGIRPGYRWDGVDRSNEYEKKWFEVQNSRQASMEENYKWSTEDM